MPLITMKLLTQGGENRILHSTDIRRMQMALKRCTTATVFAADGTRAATSFI
jgi:hypothetical protein